MIRQSRYFISLLLLATLAPLNLQAQFTESDSTLVLYTSWKEEWLAPALKEFQTQTSIKVRAIYFSQETLNSQFISGSKPPEGDLIIAQDAYFFPLISNKKILASVQLENDNAAPTSLQKNRGWISLAYSPRGIAYHSKKVGTTNLQKWETTGHPSHKGQTCLRSKDSIFTYSQIAQLSITLGGSETYNLIGRWIKNLATFPFFSDTEIIRAVANLDCEIGIVNESYFKIFKDTQDEDALKFITPKPLIASVVAIGIMNKSKNTEQAEKFVNFLTSRLGQEKLTQVSNYRPLHSGLNADLKSGDLQQISNSLREQAGFVTNTIFQLKYK
jgi:iron(III) transport system substrate-binding protein